MELQCNLLSFAFLVVSWSVPGLRISGEIRNLSLLWLYHPNVSRFRPWGARLILLEPRECPWACMCAGVHGVVCSK